MRNIEFNSSAYMIVGGRTGQIISGNFAKRRLAEVSVRQTANWSC